MDAFYCTLAILLIAFLFLVVFMIGAWFMRSVMRDAQDEARHQSLQNEYYRLAGVQKSTDPKPYVPPCVRTPRAYGMIPGLGRLERALRNGKRGTIMLRAGDRNRVG